MATKVAIINGKTPSGGVGGVSDADLSAFAIDFLQAGYVGTEAFKVTPPGSSSRAVVIKAGRYYARNAAGTMVYVVDLDTDTTLSLTANASGNPRKDAVVLKIDTATTPDNLASNVASFVAVAGTPAASPSAPDQSAIQTSVGAGNVGTRLGDVTCASGYTTVTLGEISDARNKAGIDVSKFSDGAITRVKIASEAWIDVSSSTTVTGWSGTPTKQIAYQKIGRMVILRFFVSGTSNSTSARIALPFPSIGSGVTGMGTGAALAGAANNGSDLTVASRAIIDSNALPDQIQCFSNMAAGVWTASGTKFVQGVLTYEATS